MIIKSKHNFEAVAFCLMHLKGQHKRLPNNSCFKLAKFRPFPG